MHDELIISTISNYIKQSDLPDIAPDTPTDIITDILYDYTIALLASKLPLKAIPTTQPIQHQHNTSDKLKQAVMDEMDTYWLLSDGTLEELTPDEVRLLANFHSPTITNLQWDSIYNHLRTINQKNFTKKYQKPVDYESEPLGIGV